MDLREVNKLQCKDKFKRPSTNQHDNGWRVYEVIGRTVDVSGLFGVKNRALSITVKDQHGYTVTLSLTAWDSSMNGSKVFMKAAVRV